MAIDPPEEHVVEPNGDSGTDNADVVLIKPDDATENEAPEANDAPLATNCASILTLPALYLYPLTLACGPLLTLPADEAMKEIVLPPLPEEPRILEDAVSTWTVEGWRQLSKKEHGPIFQAGGFPWYVTLSFLLAAFPLLLKAHECL